MITSTSAILALDVGERRIGVAKAGAVARIPGPLLTLDHAEDIFQKIAALLQEHEAAALVVGLPRGLSGQHTQQTGTIEAFVTELKNHVTVPMYWQDEAVTSEKAEAELKRRGKPYAKGDIDALAATYILDDFLGEHPEIRA